MTGKEILEFNRLLATERDWVQGEEARLFNTSERCTCTNLNAVAFSLDGALLRVVGPERLYTEALGLFMHLGPGKPVNPNNALTILLDFNDTTAMSWKNLKTRLMSLVATE